MFRAVGDGRIKAHLDHGDKSRSTACRRPTIVREAMQACPFVVVSDVERHTDTTAFAHVLLPIARWGEKNGTVTNSERCISRQRAFLDTPGEAKPDWWQLAEVGKTHGVCCGISHGVSRLRFSPNMLQ